MEKFMSPFLAFMNLGPMEIGLIAFLALLLFGGKKLPGLARDLGTGIRQFRKELSGESEDTSEEYTEPKKVVKKAVKKAAKKKTRKS